MTLITRLPVSANNKQLHQQKDCYWAVYLAWKSIGIRGSGQKGFVLGITNDTHSHPPAPDPLRYKIHEKALEEYQEAVRVAQAHRETFLSYTASQRILDHTGYALDRHTYYNLCQRLISSISSKQDLFHGLVAALKDADFRYSLRFDDELDSNGKVVSSQLQQIFFAHPIQIGLAQRFLPGFLFLIDGTFNTNKLNLVRCRYQQSRPQLPCCRLVYPFGVKSVLRFRVQGHERMDLQASNASNRTSSSSGLS